MRELLQDCQKIELLASDIYQHFFAQTEYPQEVRATFRRLASDEHDHARLIALAIDTPGLEQKAVNRVSGERIDAALRLAEQLHQTVLHEHYDEEQALRMAITIEESFINAHVGNFLHFDNQRLAELFDDLGRADQQHIDTLRQCLSWWHRERRDAFHAEQQDNHPL